MTNYAPYMVAQAAGRSGVQYDILEGQWKCTDVADSTYYCIHNWYNARGTFTGIVDGSGYAGFQYKDNSTWTIFSMWENEHGRPMVEYAPSGCITGPFSGEGTGVQVLIRYPWIKDRWYTMRIQAKSEKGRTSYEQWIKPEEGAWNKLAVISFPISGLGFTWDCFFLEDWIGNDHLRSCQWRRYYARKTRFSAWSSLDRFTIYNTQGSKQNVLTDCGYGKVGKDAIWISSGGKISMTIPNMPHELKINQAGKPFEKDFLK